ncbi:MAG: hypothetical protein ACK4L7_10220, partial [Flavobacteriales bacterium]
FHLNGSYYRYKHRVHLSAWVNTGIGQRLPPTNRAAAFDPVPGNTDTGFDPISFNFRYANGTPGLLLGSSWFAHARVLDGLRRLGAGFAWDLPNGRTTAQAEALYFWRRDSTDLTYLIHPEEWELGTLNASLNLSLRHRYQRGGTDGNVLIEARNSAPGAAMGYGWLRLTAINANRKGRLELRTRLVAQYGSGSTPRESQLYLAGGSPEDMMESKYMRSIGFTPFEWNGYGAGPTPLHFGGGLGLRGYAGYVAPETDADGRQVLTYRGATGIGASAELDLDGLARFSPGAVGRALHLDAYLFGDAGVMGYRRISGNGTVQELAQPRADAGIGFALTIKRWGPLTDIKPLTLRFDMPLLLSALPASDDDHLGFRYILAIGRSF